MNERNRSETHSFYFINNYIVVDVEPTIFLFLFWIQCSIFIRCGPEIDVRSIYLWARNSLCDSWKQEKLFCGYNCEKNRPLLKMPRPCDLCDIQPGKKMVHLFCVTKRTANIYSLPICILWMDIWMEQKKNGILLDLTNVAVHVDWAQKY